MECENKVKGDQGCDRLQFFLSILVVAAIFTHATQASFDLLRAVKKVHVYVSVVDILLGLAFLLWVVRRIARKDFRLPCVPLAAWAAVVWMGLSLIPALKGGSLAKLPLEKRGIMEILQFIEYFVIGFVLFVELFRNARWRRWAVSALWCATAVTLVVALWQYARGIGVMDVRGAWFDNRNSLAPDEPQDYNELSGRTSEMKWHEEPSAPFDNEVKPFIKFALIRVRVDCARGCRCRTHTVGSRIVVYFMSARAGVLLLCGPPASIPQR
jgi:hypothetical protein